MKLAELAQKYGLEIVGIDAGSALLNTDVTGIAPVQSAKSSEVTFITSSEYEKYLSETQACAVITARVLEFTPDKHIVQLVHKNPYAKFAQISQLFWDKRQHVPGVDPKSFIGKAAKIGKDVTIYAFATVEDGASIGDRSVIYPGVFVGKNAIIGANTQLRANVVVEDGCVIGANVTIHANTVIGCDGFGYAPSERGLEKIPQVGIVRIEDDVEIGSGSHVHRAAFGETTIGKSTKLDSTVHIGHNVKIGQYSILCGGVTIAGSAKVGDRVVLAGQVGVTNGVTIASDVKIGGKSGVTKNIDKVGDYQGFPAVPVKEWRREVARLRRLESMEKRLQILEKSLEAKS